MMLKNEISALLLKLKCLVNPTILKRKNDLEDAFFALSDAAGIPFAVEYMLDLVQSILDSEFQDLEKK